ncbi:hypothetical protein KUL106_36410 [Alteromonas sp. KUL106]|nr:hypothetical protein KUL106_36410 [Alteromonas sp. KUL106]
MFSQAVFDLEVESKVYDITKGPFRYLHGIPKKRIVTVFLAAFNALGKWGIA